MFKLRLTTADVPRKVSRDLQPDPACISRTRSSNALYIKQNNDGRRTAGFSQPGIVNKTIESEFYLQK